jgi:hypothetical protein
MDGGEEHALTSRCWQASVPTSFEAVIKAGRHKVPF